MKSFLFHLKQLSDKMEKKWNREILFDLIKKVAVKESKELISVPANIYGFGEIEYEKRKCTVCLQCVEACPSEAYLHKREFDLSSILNINEETPEKIALIYKFIQELAISKLEGIVEVPNGLLGFGSVEFDRKKCISCAKCVGLCPTKALTFKNKFDLTRVFG